MTEVSKWSGIIPALVTPLTSAGAPDVRGLTRIIDYVVTRGVHGLSILGSTGEGALLPRRVQHEVLEATMTMNQTRPVLVGILAAVPRDALEFARFAFENGADGVMMTPPFYYPLDQRGVSEFYTVVDREVSGPVFIYHIPSLTRIELDPDTVIRLADLPHVVGIKDSSRDPDFHRQIITRTRGKAFQVFAGSGAMLPTNFMCGGAGAIAASANCIPDALVGWWDALQKEDKAESARWERYVLAVEQVCRRFPFPINWKTCLEVMGLLSAEPAFPLQRLSPEQVAAMRAALGGLGLKTQQANRV